MGSAPCNEGHGTRVTGQNPGFGVSSKVNLADGAHSMSLMLYNISKLPERSQTQLDEVMSVRPSAKRAGRATRPGLELSGIAVLTVLVSCCGLAAAQSRQSNEAPTPAPAKVEAP